MNRTVVAVLVATFVALVAATAWVPVELSWTGTWVPAGSVQPTKAPPVATDIEWRWVGLAIEGYEPPAWLREEALEDDPIGLIRPYPVRTARLAWRLWVVEVGLIIAIGGLLALWLRTRAGRREPA